MMSLLFTLIILGLLFYVIQLIPMAEPYPLIIKIFAAIIAILLIAQYLGLTTGIPLNLR